MSDELEVTEVENPEAEKLVEKIEEAKEEVAEIESEPNPDVKELEELKSTIQRLTERLDEIEAKAIEIDATEVSAPAPKKVEKEAKPEKPKRRKGFGAWAKED